MLAIPRARRINAGMLICILSFLIFAMYPGRFDGDEIGQYQQGMAFAIDDSHSVMLAALLGVLSDISAGPGPMFVLQLALWFGGIFMFTDALIEANHPRIGQSVSILVLTPLLTFDFFDIQKDALFTGLIAILIGVGARIVLKCTTMSVIDWFLGFCIFTFALDVRQNAIFLLIPLWLLASPIYRLKKGAIAVCFGSGLIVFGLAGTAEKWIDNTILHTHHSHIIYALQIFDLAGITARTHHDASQGLFPNFVENVTKCYNPHRWDAFASNQLCPDVGSAAQQLVAIPTGRRELTYVWIKEIFEHPVAYVKHRARNFGCLIRIGCYDDVDMSTGWSPRPWDGSITRVTVATRIIGAMGHDLWRSFLGAGWLWILVVVAQLTLSAQALRRRGFEPIAYLTFAVSSGTLCYVAALAFIDVADQLRYLHPVFFLAIVGIPLAAGCIKSRTR